MTALLRAGDYEVVVATDKGMNVMSFKKGNIEVIDQTTRTLFEERFAGLGAMIGPHFHRRHPATILPFPFEERFPHIARVKAQNIPDPFTHGIGRYAPWKATIEARRIQATLSGKEEWNGVPLSQLEGQQFEMRFSMELTTEGLQLDLSVVSETDSLVGIHYYYHVPEGPAVVKNGRAFRWDLAQPIDQTFRPEEPLGTAIELHTATYCLTTSYRCPCAENCWQLWRPEGTSFVCIEPISSHDPKHPNLSVSALSINLAISNQTDPLLV